MVELRTVAPAVEGSNPSTHPKVHPVVNPHFSTPAYGRGFGHGACAITQFTGTINIALQGYMPTRFMQSP